MNIVVYGANGWTGSLVATTLDRLGHRVVLAGRNKEKLEALKTKLGSASVAVVGDPRDRGAMERLFKGADVVVPCAGPYRDFGDAMLDAALACRCHYFDVCGEYEFVGDVYRRYDAPARDRGLTFCTGFAVKGVTGDWCATMAAGDRSLPIDEVAVAYAHAFREYLFASPGSMVSAASQGLFNSEDRYDPKKSIARRFEFPAPFGHGTALLVPMTDEVTIPRYLPSAQTRNYVAVAPGTFVNDLWAGFFTSNLKSMPQLATLIRGNPGFFKAIGDQRAIVPTTKTFAAMAQVTRGGQTDGVGITLNDGYQATADMIAYAIARLGEAPRGAVTPSQLCDARTALRDFARGGFLTVHRWTA